MCETRYTHGEKVIKGVVMDGTALGILGALPNFSRHAKFVNPVKGVPDKQYIVRDPKLYASIDSVLVSPRNQGEENNFFVSLRATSRRAEDGLYSQLF